MGAGNSTTTGNDNVYLGRNAGNTTTLHTTGSNCIIIGNEADPSSATVSNEITLGDTNITRFRVPGLTIDWTATSKPIEALVLNNGYTEEVYAISDGATVNLDPNNGSIQTWTLGANRTPGQANWSAGQSITLLVDDGTAYTLDWSTLSVVWKTDAGSAPTLNTSGETVIVLWKVSTTIYGARVGDA